MLALFCSLLEAGSSDDDRGSMMSSLFGESFSRLCLMCLMTFASPIVFSILFALNEKYQRSLFDLGKTLYARFYVENGYGDIPRLE